MIGFTGQDARSSITFVAVEQIDFDILCDARLLASLESAGNKTTQQPGDVIKRLRIDNLQNLSYAVDRRSTGLIHIDQIASRQVASVQTDDGQMKDVIDDQISIKSLTMRNESALSDPEEAYQYYHNMDEILRQKKALKQWLTGQDRLKSDRIDKEVAIKQQALKAAHKAADQRQAQAVADSIAATQQYEREEARKRLEEALRKSDDTLSTSHLPSSSDNETESQAAADDVHAAEPDPNPESKLDQSPGAHATPPRNKENGALATPPRNKEDGALAQNKIATMDGEVPSPPPDRSIPTNSPQAGVTDMPTKTIEVSGVMDNTDSFEYVILDTEADQHISIAATDTASWAAHIENSPDKRALSRLGNTLKAVDTAVKDALDLKLLRQKYTARLHTLEDEEKAAGALKSSSEVQEAPKDVPPSSEANDGENDDAVDTRPTFPYIYRRQLPPAKSTLQVCSLYITYESVQCS